MCTEKLGTLSEFVNNLLLLTGQRAQRVVSQVLSLLALLVQKYKY
jgi:hypothetical protein